MKNRDNLGDKMMVKRSKFKKRKMALLLGFSGQNYFVFQRNKGRGCH